MSEAVPAIRRRVAISFSGGLSLLAVVAVLVVVSVPRLRGLAQRENEADAAGTAQMLARALQVLDAKACHKPGLRELLRLPELSALGDIELLAGGKVLRRHGYLFEVTCLSPAITAPCGPAALLCGEPDALGSLLAIRAWPWALEVTGSASFLVTRTGGRLVFPSSPVSWQGLEAAGVELTSLAGWRPES